VRRLARAEQSRVGIEMVIKHHRARDPCIDDCANGAGPDAVGICIGGLVLTSVVSEGRGR
jgi:hypothetical protein